MEELRYDYKSGEEDVDDSEVDNSRYHLSTDWSIFSNNKRRCISCDEFKKEKKYSDFICKHVRGFVEAPANVRRCYGCDRWRNEKKIEGDFWCKHRKEEKDRWNNYIGWKGASKRAEVIRGKL